MEFTVKVATPLESVPVPRVAFPSRKVTVPVAAEGEVVAVKVTFEPAAGVVFEAVSAVEELWAVTVTLKLLSTKLA